MNGSRTCVENNFAEIENTFQIVSFKRNMKILSSKCGVGNLYKVATLLNNFRTCMRGSRSLNRGSRSRGRSTLNRECSRAWGRSILNTGSRARGRSTLNIGSWSRERLSQRFQTVKQYKCFQRYEQRTVKKVSMCGHKIIAHCIHALHTLQ